MLCTDAGIAAHGAAFLDLSLPKACWTHEGHFAAALWLLRCRPDIDLKRDMPGLIRAYNEATGGANTDTEGYHETITQASIRAARAFAAGHPGPTLADTLQALMASKLGRAEWLLAHWSGPRLASPQARREWIEPDRAPFPY